MMAGKRGSFSSGRPIGAPATRCLHQRFQCARASMCHKVVLILVNTTERTRGRDQHVEYRGMELARRGLDLGAGVGDRAVAR